MNKVILLVLFFSVTCFARDPLEVSCIINKQNARITVLYTNTNDIPVLVYLRCLYGVKDLSFYASPDGNQADDDDPILIRLTELWYPPRSARSGEGYLHQKKEQDRTVSLKKGESIGTTFPLWELAIYKDLARVLLFRSKNGASKDAQRAIDRNVTKLKVESSLIFLVKDASGKLVASPSSGGLSNSDSFILTKASIEMIERIRRAEGAEFPVHHMPEVPIPDPNAGDW